MKDSKKVVIILCSLVFLLIITTILHNNINNKNIEMNKINTNDIKKILNEKIELMTADDLLIDLYKKDIVVNEDNSLLLSGILLSVKEDGELAEKESDKLYDRIGICTNTSYINLKTVEDNISKLYGENLNLDYTKLLKNSDFYYDVKTEKFYTKCVSSFNKSNYIESYIYDYKINEKGANIYIAVALLEEEYDDDDVKIYVYKDLDKNKLYNKYNEDEYFILDETNYSEFALYKYYFENKNGNYYFKSLKKIN